MLRGGGAAGTIIAPGARARHSRTSPDVPGIDPARGRVGGTQPWAVRTLLRRDLGLGPVQGDIAPESRN